MTGERSAQNACLRAAKKLPLRGSPFHPRFLEVRYALTQRHRDITSPGTIPAATKLTVATTNWTSGSTAGKQKGAGQLVFLTTGSTDNSAALAVDVYLDFSGVNAGTLSFTCEGITNSTGDRRSSLRVYWSTDGAAFTELAAAQVLNVPNGTPATNSVSAVALPAAFNNEAGARLRFYSHNGTGGTTGNRPKLGLDNLTVTATAGSGDYPVATITNLVLTEFAVG